MILEYIIDYRSSSQIYEKCFLKSLKKNSLEGKVLKDGFYIKCYVKADNTEDFASFATDFAKKLPHSIFLYDTKVNVIDNMPSGNYTLENKKKLDTPFCLDCLEAVLDENNNSYYDIFQSCELCGYNVEGEHRNYKKEILEIVNIIKSGKNIKLNTLYGTYNIGIVSKICNDINFDIVAYDYATIKKYTHAKDYELKALASMEKPLVKLKTNIKFKTDIEDLQNELIRFKLADDFILYLLLEELNKDGISMLFITKADIETANSFTFVQLEDEKEPIEIVASQSNIAIVSGNKGLVDFPILTTEIAPIIGATYSVIKEHNLKDDNIAGIYLSKKYQNGIIIYGKKYGMVNYLSLECEYSSISDIFEKIKSTDETGAKLIKNYISKFPNHCENILDVSFSKHSFNLYEFWGIMSVVLNLSSSYDLITASNILENNSISFLGAKGPRIDYKLNKNKNITSLDFLMILRSAMSFKLAGIDDLTLSYGIIESFAEFIVNEIGNIKDNFSVTSTVLAGSLFENNKLFAKLNTEAYINDAIYFNNQLLIDEINITYGNYIH